MSVLTPPDEENKDRRNVVTVSYGISGSMSAISIIFLSVILTLPSRDIALNIAAGCLAVAIPFSALNIFLSSFLSLEEARISEFATGVTGIAALASGAFLGVAIGATLWHMDINLAGIYSLAIAISVALLFRFRSEQHKLANANRISKLSH